MRGVQDSLRLVGGLLLAAGRAVAAFGQAVYPVSKALVVDLTSGLNALAGIIRRNQGLIRNALGRALSDVVAVVRTASAAIGALSGAFSRLGPVAKGVIVGVGAALAIAFGPESVAVTGAVLATGEIIRHWTQVKAWFSNFGRFIVNVFDAAWTGIKGATNLGVYGVLQELKLLSAELSKALGWVPGIGGKIKAALAQVDEFINEFKVRGVAELQAAGAQMGSAWGSAFAGSVTASVNAALDRAAKQGGVVLRRGGLYVPPPTAKSSTKAAAAATSTAVASTVGSSSVFGTPPPFTKNLPSAGAAASLEIPLRLQLQQAKADASGLASAQRAAAIAIKRWAETMIHTGHLTTQRLIDAYNLIAQENATLASLAKKAAGKIKKAPELISEHGLGQMHAHAAAAVTSLGKAGENEAQFLSSAQSIIRSYAPNFAEQFPTMPTTKPGRSSVTVS